MRAGKYAKQLKQPKHAENSYTAISRRAAMKAATAKKLLCLFMDLY